MQRNFDNSVENPMDYVDFPTSIKDIVIPQTEKTSRIVALNRHTNPIYVRLADGTEASFTYDEYRRIKGEPMLGKVMTIVFQRRPEDLSQEYSKIDQCIVRD